MRVVISTSLATVVLCMGSSAVADDNLVVANGERQQLSGLASPVSIAVDARVDVPIAAVGGASWIASEIFKADLVSDRCRWCDRDGAGHDTLNGLDSSVRDAFKWSNTSTANTVSNITGFVGAPLFALGGVTLGAALDHRIKDAPADALLVIESAVLAADLNQFVKFVAMRERPFVHVLPPLAKPDTPQPADNNVSFFSGHTTLVFSLAVSAGTVTSMRHRKLAPFVWAAGLTAAVSTTYLRIAADKHYFTDVLTGAAFGSLFGFVVPFFFHAPIKSGEVAWSLVPVPGGLGVGGVY